MQSPIIQFEKVSRQFGGRDALKGIDFQVPEGVIAGLVGPNGSGKTTLLKLMAGFIKTTSGEVRLFGYDPFVQRHEVMRLARFAFAPPGRIWFPHRPGAPEISLCCRDASRKTAHPPRNLADP